MGGVVGGVNTFHELSSSYSSDDGWQASNKIVERRLGYNAAFKRKTFEFEEVTNSRVA